MEEKAKTVDSFRNKQQTLTKSRLIGIPILADGEKVFNKQREAYNGVGSRRLQIREYDLTERGEYKIKKRTRN